MIEETLQKLDKLRNLKDWHKDDKDLFDSYESKLRELQSTEAVLDIPQIRQMLAEKKDWITRIDFDLANIDTLTEAERTKKFALKEILKVDIEALTPDSTAKGIESGIDSLLRTWENEKSHFGLKE